jgi:hypothetical protein
MRWNLQAEQVEPGQSVPLLLRTAMLKLLRLALSSPTCDANSRFPAQDARRYAESSDTLLFCRRSRCVRKNRGIATMPGRRGHSRGQRFLRPAWGLTRMRSGLPSACSSSNDPVLLTRSLSFRKP